MSKQGIATQVRVLLEGRGRWLRAGHDNIINYVSMLLGNGPQTDDLLELFRDVPDWLFVEWVDGQIIRIGLSAWLCQSDIETETTPSSELELWELIGRLHSTVADQGEDLVRLGGDLRAAQHLLDEAGTHTCQPVVQRETVDCDHGDLEAELAAVQQKLANVTSAQSSLREAYDKLRDARSKLQREFNAAKRDWERFVEDPNSDPDLFSGMAYRMMQQRLEVLHVRVG